MNIGECLEYAQALCDATSSSERSMARKGLREAILAMVAAEREACARVAERAVAHPMMPVAGIAMRIRERSNAELCGVRSTSERAPGYASAPNTEE